METMTDQPTTPAASLSWGVKQSLRGYVALAQGQIEASGGATRADDGGFVFPAAPGATLTLSADGTPEGSGTFAGEVRFEAHGGMLKVFLADPIIEIGPAGAIMTVADSRARNRRVELARLDLAGATIDDDGTWIIPTSASRDGWQVLGDHYPPSTPLDPVRLTLAIGE
jgi:hypothetical protein